MTTCRLYQVDAFTTERFRGNPAGVVPNADGLTEVQMQAIAREMNNSETAFVLSPTGPDHDVWVRFFTPTTEVPSCGHATVASAPTADVLAHGRMFAPAIGIAEDPVTGNANGPLGAYLVQHGLVPTAHETFAFKAVQGEAIGRPGTVEVAVDVTNSRPRKVRVGGRAVVVFQTELRL